MQKESPFIVVLTKKIDEQCIAFLPFFLFNICNYRSASELPLLRDYAFRVI